MARATAVRTQVASLSSFIWGGGMLWDQSGRTPEGKPPHDDGTERDDEKESPASWELFAFRE